MDTLNDELHGYPLAAFAELVTVAALRSRFGDAFLALSNLNAGLEVPEGPKKTMAIKARSGGIASAFRVWPVRKTERSLIGRFVSIGRIRTNDVVVPDVSLSKFHALVTETEDGGRAIQDARSKNGTFVNGQRVAAQGEGPPTALRRGDRVRLGGVELTYLDAEGLGRWVRRVLL